MFVVYGRCDMESGVCVSFIYIYIYIYIFHSRIYHSDCLHVKVIIKWEVYFLKKLIK
jgi:hypothetical protein